MVKIEDLKADVKFKVREDLIEDGYYGSHFFVRQMDEFIGKVLTVKGLNEWVDIKNGVLVKENGYTWSPEMIEHIIEDKVVKIEDLKVGVKFRIKEELEVGRLYDACSFIEEMKEFLGKTLTVAKSDDAWISIFDAVKVEENKYTWALDMIECIVEDKSVRAKEIKVGTLFKVKDNLEVGKDYNGVPFTKSMVENLGKILIAEDAMLLWRNHDCVISGMKAWSSDMIEYVVGEASTPYKKFMTALSSMSLTFSVKDDDRFNRIVSENNKKVARLNSEGYHTNSDFNKLCTKNKIKLLEAMDEYVSALKIIRLKQAEEDRLQKIKDEKEEAEKNRIKDLIASIESSELDVANTPHVVAIEPMEVSQSNASMLVMKINSLDEEQFGKLMVRMGLSEARV